MPRALPHAISTFISHNFTPNIDLKKATYICYEAKKNAEKAPEVGSSTDIGIVDEKEIKILSNDDIDKLSKIYHERMRVISQSVPNIEKMIAELPFRV
jgi:20S proteasome alpha/beta subunit